MSQGFFIVLEGSDGSGKGTQFRLLKERLKAVGYEVETFDFPRYDKQSSYFVQRYLNGAYGSAANISPYSASLFFALDRFEAASDIKKALAEGKVVLANRYVGSNMAHMGSKIKDPLEQRSFFVWEDSLEFQLLNLPRPNVNIFLKVPAEISYELIAKKDERSYTAKNRDEHEADMEHLKSAVDTYSLLCQLFPSDFVAIDCVENDKLLGIPEINNKIWNLIRTIMPTKPAQNGHKVTLRLSETVKAPQAIKEEGSSVAAASISLGLLTQIEAAFPGTASYNLKGLKGSYEYLTPDELDSKTKTTYQKSIGELADLYKKIAKQSSLNDDTRQRLLPLATLVDTSFNLAKEQRKAFKNYLLDIGSAEALKLAVKTVGKTTAKTDQRQPQPINKILSDLASENLPKTLAAEVDPVRLVQAVPRNEFSVLADAIYPYSNMPRDEIETSVETWTYQQKYQTLRSAVLSQTSVPEVFYKLDIIADCLQINKLLASGAVLDAKLQAYTTRYGYGVPAELDGTEVEDHFMACFDKSLELFSTLQSSGHEALASLAVLAGHKQRVQITLSLRTLKESVSISSEEDLKVLTESIVDKIGEAHPIIASSLAEPSPEEETPKPVKKSSSRRRSRRHSRKPKKS